MSRRAFKDLVAQDVTGQGASPAWVRWVTAPASWLFAGGARVRSAGYDLGVLSTRRLPGRTLSVGNLTVGGTGKSPIVIALARGLFARGLRPAILARGYGAGLAPDDSLAMLAGSCAMTPKTSSTREIILPDEGRMQSVALPSVPVVVGADRFAAASRWLAERPDAAPTHWLLDDGFQHRRLARDADIVLLDATRPFGNGRLLPRGALRESPVALRRASMVIFTRATDGRPDAKALGELASFYAGPTVRAEFRGGRIAPIDGAPEFGPDRCGRALAVAGVARPEVFLDQLRGQGIELHGAYIVGDHGVLAKSELVSRACGAQCVVTTAKDYWRDPGVFADLPIPVYVSELVVDLDVDGVLTALATSLGL